jgi:hypothetical protein
MPDYGRASGFPDWHDARTEPQGKDAERPIMWLCAGERGLHVVRKREDLAGPVLGWRFQDPAPAQRQREAAE